MGGLRPVAAAVGAAAALAAAACAGPGRVPATGGAPTTRASVSATSAPGGTQPNDTVPGSGTGVSLGSRAEWPTYHHDAGRSGVEPQAPAAGAIAKAWTSQALDGAVYGEPLVVGDIVVAATEGDSVYGLSASTGKVSWSVHLGRPMAGSALPCGNIDPTGITGTPVIDPVAGLVWVVAFVWPGRHQLVGVDLSSGQVRSRRPADPPGVDPLVEQERGALTLSSGTVYIPYGGLYGDCGDYHGFVVALPETGPGPLRAWQVPTAREGGLWAPPGPVVAPGGELYVATGNGSSTSSFDNGNAVVRLSPGLVAADVFAPANWAELSNSDTDLGSVSPTLLPGGLIFQVGKEGVGYLLSAAHLGGVGGQLFAGPICQSAFGGTAVAGSRIYVPCTDGLVALDVSTGPRFDIAWRHGGSASGSPVVAGGVVWMVDTDGRLWGLDPSTARIVAREDVGPVTRFVSPAVGGDKLFVPTGAVVVAYRGV